MKDASAAIALGLDERTAHRRWLKHGPNELNVVRRMRGGQRLVLRLTNPLLLILMGASVVAAFTGDHLSLGLVASVVLCSLALDLFQEQRADRAVDALKDSLALRARVWRNAQLVDRPARELVPGDIVELAAGGVVPADGRVLQSKDCFVNQALLTGEALPVLKSPLAAQTRALPPAQAEGPFDAANALFAGCAVVSGSARMEVTHTGSDTALGRLSAGLQEAPPPTAFEISMRRFGMLLMRWTFVLVLSVLLINLVLGRPWMESFLFSVALAVGLTPELLPMIMSVTLARGAMRMATQQVITKRLSAIEDLGAMDVLCTDKTGTLTEAAARVEQSLDAAGQPSRLALELAWLNSAFTAGPKSSLDDAIRAESGFDAASWSKLSELPFDFERKCVSVLLQGKGARMLICKGAPEAVLPRCRTGLVDQVETMLDEATRARVRALFEARSAAGLRLLAVARRDIGMQGACDLRAEDEDGLVLVGFIALADPPKASAEVALRALHAHGVAVKIITGDNAAVTRHLCAVLRHPVRGVLEGAQVAALNDASLRAAVKHADLFCRVTPEQKNRIVQAFRANGHVVGYLGDGANDAPSLHSADVGISVDHAVDVARQAADLVLLRHDLNVLLDGVREGRRTVINVGKYVYMATSSNFGNMVSMAAAALFLPFLPMRASQVLLNNLLYDVSELALPVDRVDAQALRRPQRFDVGRVRHFMIWFGLLSSLFDVVTFALLLFVIKANEASFQTAWFVQSLATQALVVFVIRTSRPAWRDRCSPWVGFASISVVSIATLMPYTPLGAVFGMVPLQGSTLALMGAVTAAYLLAAEMLKRLYFSRFSARFQDSAARS